MIQQLAKLAVTYAVAGAATQAGMDLYANRKLVKAKVKKVIEVVKEK